MSNRGDDRRRGERRLSQDRRKEQLPVQTERRAEDSRRDVSERGSGKDRRNS